MKKAILSLLSVAALGTGVALADTAKLDFDTPGDVYGLTRVTTTTSPSPSNVGTLLPEWSYTEGDVEFSFTRGEGSGVNSGFALIESTASNRDTQGTYGFGISGGTNTTQIAVPVITITVPGGKITGVNILASGNGWNGGSEIFLTAEGTTSTIHPQDGAKAAGATIAYENKAGVNSVSFSWAARFYMAYIHTITVEYTIDAGDKLKNELSFNEKEVTGILKSGGVFNSPVLNNPNNLEVTWSSSNTAVATVDQNGKVTLVGGGDTHISAAFAGNEAYAKGTVGYDLTVLRAANNIKQLFEYAPKASDRVYVNFPMTVTYFNSASGAEYVMDLEGNAALVRGEKLEVNGEDTEATPRGYSRGDVIPQGWIATNTPEGTSTWTKWVGFTEPASGDMDVVFPRVNEVTPADAYKVVVLKKLTVTKSNAGDEAYYGVADGKTYEIRNSFGTRVPEGTWDVTCIVQYATRGTTTYFYIMPISVNEPAALEFPDSFNLTVDNKGVTVDQYMDEDEERYTIELGGKTTSETVVLTFDLPEGWDSVVGYNTVMGGWSERAQKANASNWVPVEDFKGMLAGENVQQGTSITFEAGKTTIGTYFLCAGDQIDVANPVMISCFVAMEEEPAEPVFPEELEVTVNGSESGSDNGIQIRQIDEDGLNVIVTGETTEDWVVITLGVPEGWDGYIGTNTYDFQAGGGSHFKKVNPVEMTPIDEGMDEMMTRGNEIKLPADGEEYFGSYYLYKGDEYDDGNMITLTVQVKKTQQSGVEAIEANEAGARYFNLQGAEVVNPEAGVYVKVLNGKTTKVIVK